MAKILMVQLQAMHYPGTAYLNGAVSEKGHIFRLCLSAKPDVVLERVRSEAPDIIGFCCMTCYYEEIKAMAGAIKQNVDIPIIIGGPHPTFCPDILNEDMFDIICRGEGELALQELMDALEAGADYTGIKNLWVKKDGTTYRNDLRPLVDPLDLLPRIDWSCYQGTQVEDCTPESHPIRGCPYACSYCFNEAQRKLYEGLGTYIRYFSVERAIEEIRQAVAFFGSGTVFFTSDSFGMNLSWMSRFLDAYEKEVGRPFYMMLRPELATEECADILARSGCHCVGMGVESGSERIRRDLLNRHYTNEEAIEAAERFHRRGIPIRTYNMLGFPTETEEDVWQTINLNAAMKADFPRAAVYVPMPNTRLSDFAKGHGFLADDFSFGSAPSSIFSKTLLDKIDPVLVENALYFFETAVKFPRLHGLIKRLMRTKPNFLYRWWFYAVFLHLHRKSERRKLIPYIRWLFAMRNST